MCKRSNHVTAMATKSPHSQAFLLGTRLVEIHLSRLLRLFTPQVAEARRIHPSYPLAAAAWSCLSSEKISDPKKSTEARQKTFPTKRKTM